MIKRQRALRHSAEVSDAHKSMATPREAKCLDAALRRKAAEGEHDDAIAIIVRGSDRCANDEHWAQASSNQPTGLSTHSSWSRRSALRTQETAFASTRCTPGWW